MPRALRWVLQWDKVLSSLAASATSQAWYARLVKASGRSEWEARDWISPCVGGETLIMSSVVVKTSAGLSHRLRCGSCLHWCGEGGVLVHDFDHIGNCWYLSSVCRKCLLSRTNWIITLYLCCLWHCALGCVRYRSVWSVMLQVKNNKSNASCYCLLWSPCALLSCSSPKQRETDSVG